MHKNTFVLILALSILAALVVGINVGKRMGKDQNAQDVSQDILASPTPTEIQFDLLTASPSPTLSVGTQSASLNASPSANLKNGVYTSPYCGVSVKVPTGFDVKEADKSGAVLLNTKNPQDMIVMTCQKQIPIPPLPTEQIEKLTVDGVSATLYHDKSSSDGTSIDALIMTHPKNGMDVFFGGFGSSFTTLLGTIKVL